MGSPYEVLQVDPDADEGTITDAYKRRVKESHPDHGGSREEFQRVREAYEQLKTEGFDPEPSVEMSAEATTAGAQRSEPETEPGQEPARVEYLDYEVLGECGWEIDDEDLFAKASDADLPPEAYGRFLVEPDESVLEAAENRGFAWPYACRGGACANCAVLVVDGELSIPVNNVLPEAMVDRGIYLSCVGTPKSDRLQIVYNVKHLPELDELRLPPHPFERAHTSDD